MRAARAAEVAGFVAVALWSGFELGRAKGWRQGYAHGDADRRTVVAAVNRAPAIARRAG